MQFTFVGILGRYERKTGHYCAILVGSIRQFVDVQFESEFLVLFGVAISQRIIVMHQSAFVFRFSLRKRSILF